MSKDLLSSDYNYKKNKEKINKTKGKNLVMNDIKISHKMKTKTSCVQKNIMKCKKIKTCYKYLSSFEETRKLNF